MTNQILHGDMRAVLPTLPAGFVDVAYIDPPFNTGHDFGVWQDKFNRCEGDVVLDPACGSGTTLAVAQRLGRRWIGIDRGQEAVRVARGRMGPANNS